MNRRSLLAAALAAAAARPAFAARQSSSFPMPAVALNRTLPNVLFIAIDDMNDFCSVLNGYPGMVTPNFDRLAAMGATCLNAMAHVPACSPSRSSILLGSASYNSGVYFNSESWENSPIAVGHDSLVGYLRKSGFRTFGTGKIFHRVDGQLRPEDWDEYFLTTDWKTSKKDLGHIASQTALDEWNTYHRESGNDFGPGDNGGRADFDHATWAASKVAE